MVWIFVTLIHCIVDFLLDMPDQPLPGTTAGRWQLLHTFLLQAGAQFRFPAALGSIPFVARTQIFVEGAVVLARAGRDEVGDAHVNAHDRRIGWRLHGHFLIVGEREPPQSLALIELHTGVELSRQMGFRVHQLFFVVGSEFDGNLHGLTLGERADRQPVIIGRIAGLLQFDHVDIGLNAGFAQGGYIPFVPYRLCGFCATGPIRLVLLVPLQILLVLLIGLRAVSTPGSRDACCLHDGNPVPAF